MNQQEQHNPPHIVHNLKNIVLIALVVVLAITVVGLGFKVTHTTESKTTKLGFEDIGEFPPPQTPENYLATTFPSHKVKSSSAMTL